MMLGDRLGLVRKINLSLWNPVIISIGLSLR
jgi:hypothetical protein